MVKKKIYILIIVIFAIAFFMSIRTPENASFDETTTLRIAGDNNHPPYEFIDVNGIYKGFNVDIMNALSIEFGMDIEFVPMEWNDAVKALEKKEVDAIQGISRTKEREERFLFTNPTAINSQVIFVREETSIVSGIEDLSGLRVAFQEGDINYEILKNIPNIILIPKNNQKETIDALLNKEVDASVGNRLTGLYYSQKYRKSHLIKIVGEPMRTTEYGPATYLGNENLINILNQGIEGLNTNGTYDKIYKKWFGEEIIGGKDIIKAYLKKILILIGILILIIIFFIVWNKKLAKEVSSRTKELRQANKELLLNQKKIHKLAYYDTVTFLPNRVHLSEVLNKLILNSSIQNSKFALLSLDLDQFKIINDTLGHDIGDMALKLVGERINQVIRKSDVFGRFGGDEFLILMSDVNHINEVVNLADRVLDVFKEPFIISEQELFLTTSIGIAIYPDAGESIIALMKHADIAMYRAKGSGGDSYCIYTEESFI